MQLLRTLPIAWTLCAAVAGFPATAQEVRLPERAAPPQPSPQTPEPESDPDPQAPESEPQAQASPAEQAADEAPPGADDIPLPEPRPEQNEERPEDAAEPSSAPAAPPPARPDAAATLIPPQEMACRARLRALGVSFETRPPEGGTSGCALPFPLSVSSLSREIALEPPALINCATAEATARFVQEVVAGEAERRFGSTLEAVRQVSGYVCRPRNGTSTLSEHAFGNAIDFGAFVLEDERVIEVRKSDDPKASGFLRHVRSKACGPFKTVLGPGTDADHADHFHFDLAQRRNMSTYCR